MSVRRKQIASIIQGLPGPVFQELAEDYLQLKHPEYQSINPAGSNEVEQKTTAGRPDTLFWLPNGVPVFVESTVKKKGVIAKLKKDIAECAELKVELDLPQNEPPILYLCYARKFKPKQDKELIDYGSSLGLIVVLVGLTQISMDVELRFPELARNYCHLPFDSGQTMSIAEFVRKHGIKNNKLTTALDNVVIGGEERSNEIKRRIDDSEVVIVSGPKGVGKTRIVLEALRQREIHEGRRARVIINNPGVDIWDDLHFTLSQQQPVDLFIDDANHQIPNLSRILFFIKKYPEKGLKVIMTVRSASIQDLQATFKLYKIRAREVKFTAYTEDEIVAIVGSPPFNIVGKDAYSYINNVAEGNARQAIMAARVVIDNNYDLQKSSVGQMYDAYYSNALGDSSGLKKPFWTKVLGYLSFHQAVDLSKRGKSYLKKDLKELGLSYKKFIKVVYKLNESELVDIQYGVAKMTDQTMSTYLIYLTFIKDQKLNFSTLFEQNFPANRNRLRGVLKELRDDFGKVDIIFRLGRVIDDILWRLKESDKLMFFDAFWFLLEDELLSWAAKQVYSLEKAKNPVYGRVGDRQKNHYSQGDSLLNLLSKLFEYQGERLHLALKISFSYISSKPDLLGEFVSNLRSALNFKSGDDKNGYARHEAIARELIAGLSQDSKLHERVFLETIPFFLKSEASVFQLHTETNRVAENAAFVPLREDLWSGTYQLFEDYSAELLEVISIMEGRYGQVTKAAYAIDQKWMFKLFKHKLSSDILLHCVVVVRTCNWLKRRGMGSAPVDAMKDEYSTDEYRIFADLSYDYGAYSDKKEDLGESIESFDKWKEGVLKNGYVYTQPSDFQYFLTVLVKVLDIRGSGDIRMGQSLSIILLENLKLNHERGLSYTKELLIHTKGDVNSLRKVIHYIFKLPDLRKEFMEFLIAYTPRVNVQHWLVTCFDIIAEQNDVDTFYADFVDFIGSVQKRCFISIDTLEKFSKGDTDFDEWVRVLNSRAVEDGTFRIHFGGLKSLSTSFIRDHIKVLEETYLIHAKRDDHFDFSHDLLEEILKTNPDFFTRFVRALYSPDNLYKRHHRDNKLGLIWKFPNVEAIVAESINAVLKRRPYTDYDSSPVSAFFEGIPNEKGKDLAQKFALKFIDDNISDVSRINAMLATIRTKMSDVYEDAVRRFIAGNTNLDDFKRVKWVSSGGIYSGNTVIGHVHAESWREFGKLLDSVKGERDITEPMAFIEEQIRINETWATSELRRMFITGHW